MPVVARTIFHPRTICLVCAVRTISLLRYIFDCTIGITPALHVCIPACVIYEIWVIVGDYLQDAAARKFGWCVKPATMYAISATTEYPEEAAKLLEFLLNSRDMAQLQGTEKGIPISDAAKAALQETQKLSGYEKQADDMRENYADRLEILQPVLENESVYDGFKVNADYYIYDKLSEDEVVEKLYEAIY